MYKLLKVIPVLMILILTSACTNRSCCGDKESISDFANPVHQEFFDNLSKLCGNTYTGEQLYRSHHGSSWADKLMLMYVSECDNEKMHIPFHIDDDHSRTWMFFIEDRQLCFRHRHLHEDGTHEDDSMYGGYADGKGSAFVQYFPADEFTGTVIDGGAGNVWIVSIAEDLTSFSYRLDRDGEKRFEIAFDLTKPVLLEE